MKKFVLILILFFLAIIGRFWVVGVPRTAVSISDETPTNQSIRNLIEFLAKNGTSGALLISQNQKVVSELYWSWPGKAVDRETLFDLGSLSKQLTGFLILQLQLEKKLSVRSQVQEILPETKGTPIGPLIVENLLHMTSGLPRDESWYSKVQSQLWKKNWESAEIIKELATSSPTSTPGTRFQYSNLGYVLLAQIIIRIEGKPLGTVLKERILSPFRMERTYLQDQDRSDKNLASGHFLIFDRWLPVPAWDYSFLQGAGGIVSNVRDLWKWDQGLRNFFSEHPELASPYYGGDNKFHYGYGWGALRGLFAHSGETPGFCAYIAKNDHSLLVLTLNSDFCESGGFQDSMNELANAVVRAN